jgi:hypothetical protein
LRASRPINENESSTTNFASSSSPTGLMLHRDRPEPEKLSISIERTGACPGCRR